MPKSDTDKIYDLAANPDWEYALRRIGELKNKLHWHSNKRRTDLLSRNQWVDKKTFDLLLEIANCAMPMVGEGQILMKPWSK